MFNLPVLIDRNFHKKSSAAFTLVLMFLASLQTPKFLQMPSGIQYFLTIGILAGVVFLSIGDLLRLDLFRQNFNPRFQTTLGLGALFFVFGLCYLSPAATDYWHYLTGMLPITWFAWFYFRMLFVFFDFAQ